MILVGSLLRSGLLSQDAYYTDWKTRSLIFNRRYHPYWTTWCIRWKHWLTTLQPTQNLNLSWQMSLSNSLKYMRSIAYVCQPKNQFFTRKESGCEDASLTARIISLTHKIRKRYETWKNQKPQVNCVNSYIVVDEWAHVSVISIDKSNASTTHLKRHTARPKSAKRQHWRASFSATSFGDENMKKRFLLYKAACAKKWG